MKSLHSVLINFLLLAPPMLVSGGNSVDIDSGDDSGWNGLCDDSASRTSHERAVGFKQRTAVRIERDEPQQEDIGEDSLGNRYRRRNLRAQSRSEGVIFLSEGRCFISAIECSSDPSTLTITIEEGNELDAEELDDLFPEDSLVVVQARVFGDCDLGQETPDFSNFPFDVPLNGYLLVESVEASEGDQQQITISGVPTSWWSGFDELEYDIDRDSSGTRERNLKTWDGRQLEDGCDSDSLVDDEREFPLLSIGGSTVASVRANVCVDIKDSGIGDFSVRVNRRNFGVSLTSVLDVFTETSLTFSFLDFDDEVEISQQFFPAIPIGSLPSAFTELSLFGDLDTSLFGSYFDMPMTFRGQHILSNTLDYTSFVGYNTGRKVTRFDIGNTGVLSTSVTDEAGSGVNYGFRAADAEDDSQMDSNIWIGVQPKIGFYSETLSAAVRLDIGTNGDYDWMGNNLGSFPAITSGLRNDACNSTHQFEADIDFRAQELATDLDVAISVGFLFFNVFEFYDSLSFTLADSLLDQDMGSYCA